MLRSSLYRYNYYIDFKHIALLLGKFYKSKKRKRLVCNRRWNEFENCCSGGEIDLGGCYFRSSWSGTGISGIRYSRSKILILAGLKPACHAFSVWLDLISTAPNQTKPSKTWVWFYNHKISPPPHKCITTTILDVFSVISWKSFSFSWLS